MPFVKLDCGILDSTLWLERECREVFITALLMAEPLELLEPADQIEIRTLNLTGWTAPPGWYGFVPAASVGILHRAGIDKEVGLQALERLGQPESESRSKDFDGRRLVRVNSGFLILNYIKYRERDYTGAERSKRYRERMAESRRGVTGERRDITQAEVEAEEEAQAEGKKIPVTNNKLTRKTDAVTKGPNGVNSRSKRPIFQGQRFVVFDWMLEDLGRTLGEKHLNEFDIDTWLWTLNEKAVSENVVKAKNDWWPWIQAELIAEAKRRGLPVDSPNAISEQGRKNAEAAESAIARIEGRK